jgi:amino acid transporter
MQKGLHALASEAVNVYVAEVEPPAGYGLRRSVLSPAETMAQSISAIALTTTPAMTIPLVFAMAGNGTWLVYLLATAGMTLIGVLIGCFARRSASPGSLYKYVTASLPPWASGLAGWALLLAYVATAVSVTGGFVQYANVLIIAALGKTAPAAGLATLAILLAAALAYRDIRLSAQSMLWLEAASVGCILAIVALVLARNGLHLDSAQFRLRGTSVSGMRLGMVLALFSFVGFESATALGEEARNPLKTIPRAVLQSAIGLGFLFVVCAYTEVLGFRGLHETLDQSAAPFHTLARQAGVSALGIVVDVGAMMSMFACVLACTTAGARVLLTMSHNGLTHAHLTRTHHRNETPHVAVLVTGIVTFVVTVALALRGVSGADIYGWMGSLATYGFLTAYALVCLAVPSFLRRERALTPLWLVLSGAGFIAMLLAIAGSVYPVPIGAYRWLPYIYLTYLIVGWFWTVSKKRGPVAVS